MDEITDKELDEMQARIDDASSGVELTRYDHGGGRSFVVFDEGTDLRSETLVADYYHSGDREFYHHALADMPRLVAELKRLRNG